MVQENWGSDKSYVISNSAGQLIGIQQLDKFYFLRYTYYRISTVHAATSYIEKLKHLSTTEIPLMSMQSITSYLELQYPHL